MVRLYILLISFIFSITVNAQTFAIEGGVNFSTVKGSNVHRDVSLSSNLLGKFGLVMEYELTKNLYLQMEGNFCSKGYFAKDNKYSNEVSIFYVEIPVNCITKISLGINSKFRFLFGAGAYLALGLDYKTKLTDLITGESHTNNGDLAGFGVKYLDLGVNALTGIEFAKKIQVTANYQPGLTRIFYGDDLGYVKNRVIGIRVFYFIF